MKYAGINPSISQSGKFNSSKNHITKQGNPYLRRALYLAALGQLRLQTPFYDYYLKKRNDGKSHREALIALARKLVHVIYAVLKNQTAYDPNKSKIDDKSHLKRFDIKLSRCEKTNTKKIK